MIREKFTFKRFHMIGAALLALASPAAAAEMVAPGETLDFPFADGGARQCRIKDLIIGEIPLVGCGEILTVWQATIPPGISLPIGTNYDAANRRVEAAFSNLFGIVAPQVGLPYYATGAVYNDFEIEDLLGAENIVDAQFSIKYSWEGGIAGLGNYDGRITLSVEVEDITNDPANPIGIASFDLAGRDRQGDQGFTDVAAGGSPYDRNDDTAAFSLKLRSGGVYRIWFKAEAYGAPLVATVLESSLRGWWDELSVTVVQDEADLILALQNALTQHDTDIKAAISTHDAQIKGAVATHDTDIKALLSMVQDDLADIKRLLNTPQGRRPEFPLK